ncbi:DUF7553 family protein [Salinilacihabitans rarus]|uniref:DUF7553 family protein n=1 Tax=Salinilacihabitans rarus TaxID=2961596 RepID=UPI0020C9319A|nr:hypothetical protein [Salinilacihabitans rarus]
MGEADSLERAREELRRASDAADRPVQTQVDSLQEGLAEELDGARTQDDPGPKVDRVSEVAEKLAGLEDEAEGDAAERIEEAREYCLAYLRERTEG